MPNESTQALRSIGPTPKRSRIKELLGFNSPGKPLPMNDEFLAENKNIVDLVGGAMNTPQGRVMGLTMPMAGYHKDWESGIDTLTGMGGLFDPPAGLKYLPRLQRRLRMVEHLKDHLPQFGVMTGSLQGLYRQAKERK